MPMPYALCPMPYEHLMLRRKAIYCTIFNKPFMGGQDAHPTRKFNFCGTGILPVLEHGAIYSDPKSFVNFLLPPRTRGEGWGGVKNL